LWLFLSIRKSKRFRIERPLEDRRPFSWVPGCPRKAEMEGRKRPAIVSGFSNDAFTWPANGDRIDSNESMEGCNEIADRDRRPSQV
jgi:hypothetical protein